MQHLSSSRKQRVFLRKKQTSCNNEKEKEKYLGIPRAYLSYYALIVVFKDTPNNNGLGILRGWFSELFSSMNQQAKGKPHL